jgi:hypothetical protein
VLPNVNVLVCDLISKSMPNMGVGFLITARSYFRSHQLWHHRAISYRQRRLWYMVIVCFAYIQFVSPRRNVMHSTVMISTTLSPADPLASLMAQGASTPSQLRFSYYCILYRLRPQDLNFSSHTILLSSLAFKDYADSQKAMHLTAGVGPPI